MMLQRLTPDSGLRSELGRLMDENLPTPWAFNPWASWGNNHTAPTPHATLQELESGFVVRVDLPGVDPEDIDVRLVGNTLTVAVEQHEQEGDGKHSHLQRFSSYRHSFTLPCAVDADSVVATTKHGVLTIELSKPSEAMPKRISVTSA